MGKEQNQLENSEGKLSQISIFDFCLIPLKSIHFNGKYYHSGQKTGMGHTSEFL